MGRKDDVDVNSGGRDVTDAGELAGPGDETQPGIAQRCNRAPLGWWCSRHEGHEGPCAARAVSPEHGSAPGPSSSATERRAAADRQIEAIEGRPADDVRALEDGGRCGACGHAAFWHVIALVPRVGGNRHGRHECEFAGCSCEAFVSLRESLEDDRPMQLEDFVELAKSTTLEQRAAIRHELEKLQRPAPTPPAAAYSAPSGKHFCRGEACAGLDYAAERGRAHPPSCLGLAQTHKGLTRAELERPPVDVALRNTDRAPAQVFAGIVGRGVNVESVHVGGEQWGRVERGPVPSPREQEALAFCFETAMRDHGGAARIRRLLYAWHNAEQLGGFDFADLWSLDGPYLAHALTLIGMIARSPCGLYADAYGYGPDMVAIIDTYGPAVRR